MFFSLGFAVSLFAIVQHFTFNGKLYWFVSVPDEAAPFGPFVNTNHFAGFVGVNRASRSRASFCFRRGGKHGSVSIFLLLFTIVPVGALVLSASRGGIIGLLLEFALLAFLSRAHQIGRRQLLGVAGIALLTGSFTLWLGVGAAVQRFEQLTRGGIAES